MNRRLPLSLTDQDWLEMAARNTTEEWFTSIEQAEKGIPSTFPEYKAPGLGSEEFSQSIDHTLLKLEATQAQIDGLCEEARNNNFKVDLPTALLLHSPQKRPCIFKAPKSLYQHQVYI